MITSSQIKGASMCHLVKQYMTRGTTWTNMYSYRSTHQSNKFYAIIPTLFSYLLLFRYPYIVSHF